MVRIGVLALQGDFAAHATALRRSGAEASEIRRCAELDRIDGLILPGGESTTLLNLMADEPWFDALRSFHARGGWILGTCAGAILLSKEVTGPAQASLGMLDAAIERNGFGRQVDSFETDLDVSGMRSPLRAVFIRAPRFRRLGAGVTCLARFGNEPVLVRQGRILAATFHPELTGDDRLHDRFARLAAGVEVVAAAS